MSEQLNFDRILSIPFIFLILALILPIVIMRDPSPVIPGPPDYSPILTYFLYGNPFDPILAPRLFIPEVLPFWGILFIVFLQMLARPKFRMKRDMMLNLIVGLLLIAFWSVLVHLIFVIPSPWIAEWYPITPIIALVLVPIYRHQKYEWIE